MAEQDEIQENAAGQRHRTVGVSMNPTLEQRAKARAEALGLKFSPYVTLCIEAELKGFSQIVRDETLDLEAAMRRAREYMTKKTLSIDFEEDIAAVIARFALAKGARCERLALVSGLRVDFVIERASADGPRRIVVECRHNVRQHYALALGQGLLLRANPEVDAVVLVVPYLTGFDPAVMKQFERHEILAVTPDTLEAMLERLGG
ncbi:MAG: hypothetical protein JW942_06150 [Opitutales bacterium]|nr:hypothetical protein [Opitutales bacterium]